MITFFVNVVSKVPVYKQLVQQVESGILNGKCVSGEQLPSMTVLADSLTISKETVKKAYAILTGKGYLEPKQGKGFFIHIPEEGLVPKVLVIFDRLNTYKQTIYDSLSKGLGDKAEVTIRLHNQDVELFEHFIEENLGQYDYYVITPHFPLGNDTKKRVMKCLGRIPNRQLIVVDNIFMDLPGNWGSVYQDFANDISTGLKQGLDKLRRNYPLNVFTLPNSLYGPLIEDKIREFCQENNIPVNFIKDINETTVRRGETYLILNGLMDKGIIDFANLSRKMNMKIGKDIFLIVYNETPLNELILGGLSTLSTDFKQMGELVSEMILSHKLQKQHCNFGLIRRSTF